MLDISQIQAPIGKNELVEIGTQRFRLWGFKGEMGERRGSAVPDMGALVPHPLIHISFPQAKFLVIHLLPFFSNPSSSTLQTNQLVEVEQKHVLG